MTVSTSRAAFGAILAAPLTGGTVMALPSSHASLPDHEVQFLALIPQLRKRILPIERA